MISFLKYEMSRVPGAHIDINSHRQQIIPQLPSYGKMPGINPTTQELAAGNISPVLFGSTNAEIFLASEADEIFTVQDDLREDLTYVYGSCGPVRSVYHSNPSMESHGSGCAFGKRFVLTAAHVVHEAFATGVNSPIWFIPGHPFKSKPYLVKTAYVAKRWIQNRDHFCDVAILVLHEEMDVVGFSGICVNLTAPRATSGFDRFLPCYPSAPPFLQQTQQIVDYGAESRWAFMYDNGLYFRDMKGDALGKIDITPGASGGPWLTLQTVTELKGAFRIITQGKGLIKPDGRSGSIYMITGINSYILTHKPGVIYGPTFDDRIGDMIEECLIDIAQDGYNLDFLP